MIVDLLKTGESEKVEFKRSVGELKEIIETVVAFANANGGWIFIGVDDSGAITGVKIGKDTIEKLVNNIVQMTDPSIYPSIDLLDINNKKVIVVTVPTGNDKPYFYRGRAYIRIGKTNRLVSRSELERIFSEKLFQKRPSNSILMAASLSDISEGKLKQFVREAKERRSMKIDFTIVSDILTKLGLLEQGKLTKAAILLFGKNPQQFEPQAIIKADVFKSPTLIIDSKTIEGTLIEQIEDALIFLKRHINVRYEISENGKRREIWEYPLEALREAIVNAVTHRDYEIQSPIYVRVFDDRIEIENPGILPQPLTVDDLREDHPSILRNPKIGKVMFLVGYIEQWGTGTNKMIEYCVSEGLPEPEFIETKITFKVIFRKEKRGLNPRQKSLLEILRYRKQITRQEYQEIFNISERTARADLEELKKRGIIYSERIGKKVVYRLST